jgi:hypothetical protein
MKKKILLIVTMVVVILTTGLLIAGTYPIWPKSTISTAAQCPAVTTANQQYTLPSPAIYYYVKVKDANVFLLEGANPVATVTPATGHGAFVGDGETWGPVRINGPKVGFIGDAAGEICFVPLYQ